MGIVQLLYIVLVKARAVRRSQQQQKLAIVTLIIAILLVITVVVLLVIGMFPMVVGVTQCISVIRHRALSVSGLVVFAMSIMKSRLIHRTLMTATAPLQSCVSIVQR